MEIKYFSRLQSTNLKAKELAKKENSFQTVIVADSQTAGYGRKKRVWFSPKGGLYFSVILKPSQKVKNLQVLTLISAIAISKVLKENFDLNSEIKWPNDVLVSGKKIAGILVENVIGRKVQRSIIGIGLNTNIKKFPKNLKKKAISLEIELKRKVDNKKILNLILKELSKIHGY